MNTEKIEKDVEKRLVEMIKERPSDLMMFMMIHMGKMVVETNAGSMELKQQSTFNGQRYEIKAKITVKKVKP